MGVPGERSRLLARTTFQTTVREGLFLRAVRARVSDGIHFIFEKSRQEIWRSRRFCCGRLRAGETRFSVAVGHGAPAVSSVWEKMSGVISPRDPDRGMRDSI